MRKKHKWARLRPSSRGCGVTLGLPDPAGSQGRLWLLLHSQGSEPGRGSLRGDTSVVCLELCPSLLNPPPPSPFASINFLNFRQIPHFLRQIKSSGQGQWKWEDDFHLLEMFGVRGRFLACSGSPEPCFCCSHSSKKDFTKAASSHHLSSAHIPDVL